MHSSMQI